MNTGTANTRLTRTIARRARLADPKPGFLGPGHMVVEVITPNDLEATDPFVLLMDDRAEFPRGQPLGDTHPHAGLETVTFVVNDGALDADEGGLQSGDVVWMTAGRGIVHGGEFRARGGAMRFLQLWLTLPEKERAAAPRFEIVRPADAPVFNGKGVRACLYSGETNGLKSPTRNHVPVTLVDVRLESGAVFEQQLSGSYNGFLYPLSGSVGIADNEEPLRTGEVGWLDRRDDDTSTVLRIVGGPDGGRVLLYAGRRQNEPTFQRGPFVAGSPAAIEQMHHDHRAGLFVRTAAPV